MAIERERFDRLSADALARIVHAEPAHDALHVRRVMAHARTIAAAEGADVDVVETAALLHELHNLPKDHPDSALSGERCGDEAAALLRAYGYDERFVARVAYCIRVHSFSRGVVPETLEARVLQDADRIDAIGAVGIARCFATTAVMGRPFYAVDDPFCRERAPVDKEFAVDHFYKKLLLVGERMHTATARRMATERSDFLRLYLQQLEREIS
jgi:uncharacterized protein